MDDMLTRTKCLAFSSLALVIYDYLITLDDEITHFWDRSWLRRISNTTVLFLVNRYCSIVTLGIIVYYLIMQDMSPMA
jgi:hypothetical protein